jgi:GNAT superfamily N-acetyltransferase
MDGRIDLERARRDAKALLKQARAGNARLRADREPVLADAQRAVAALLGYPSWPAMVRDLEAGEALLAAAREGRGDEAYRLLEAGAPPNFRDASGRTALQLAAARGLPDVVGVLIGWVPVDREGAASDDPVVARMLAPRSPEVDAALGEAMWAADAALCEHVAARTVRRAAGDGFAFRTGLMDDTRNGVACSRVDDVGEVLAWLRGVPGQWLVGPGSSLGPRLERAGCRPERSAVFMAGELDRVPGEGIAPVADEATLRAFVEPGEAALLASLGLRHFAAWRDGEPVGLVSTFASPGALTITYLGVVPAWRRQGIGRALVRHVADGLTLLAPTPASIPFYERLGFRLLRCLPDRTFYTPV